jgi:hypothetical protein
MSNITISVDDSIAQALANANADERSRMEEAFNLWWSVYFQQDKRNRLTQMVAYFREKSAERGITDWEIDKILNNE